MSFYFNIINDIWGNSHEHNPTRYFESDYKAYIFFTIKDEGIKKKY